MGGSRTEKVFFLTVLSGENERKFLTLSATVERNEREDISSNGVNKARCGAVLTYKPLYAN